MTEFGLSLENFYSNHNKDVLANYYPASSLRKGVYNITPYYIYQIGDISPYYNFLHYDSSITNTYTSKILFEFKDKFYNAITTVENLKSTARAIRDNTDMLQNNFDGLSKRLISFKSNLDKIANDYINPWYDIQRSDINDRQHYIAILFGVIIFLQLLNIIFISLFAVKNKQIFRYGNHIAWILLLLLTVVTYVLGSFIETASVCS